jgi:uncharacterized membrane protein
MAVVFALMSLSGAWVAWHRSPVYAGQSGLRVLGSIALLIAAAVLAIVATVHFIQPYSETLQFIVMGVLIVALTLGLIFSIQAVSIPKESRLDTQLPPTATVLTVHRDIFYRRTKIVVGAFVVGAAGLIIPGPVRYVLAGLDAIGVLMASVCLPLLYVFARKCDRALTGLTLNPWIHWRYSPAQWQSWSDVQTARLGAVPVVGLKQQWRKLIWPCAGIAGGVMLFSPLTRWQNAVYVLLIWCILLALVQVTAWSAHRAPARLQAKLHDAAPEAFMGHDGLYCNGRFLAWLGADFYLTAAAVDPRPPRSLVFHFEKMVPNPYGPVQTIRLDENVLIPDGSDADVARLSAELKTRCPSARIALT